MKYVSRKTGLNPHTIRAWEKRYGEVIPERTEANRRLYSQSDIQRLRLLRRLTLGGQSIGHLAGLPMEDLKNLLEDESELVSSMPLTASPNQPASAEELMNEALKSLAEFNQDRLEELMYLALRTYSRRIMIEKFLVLFLNKMGEMWRQGTLRIAQEHFASSVIRGFLANLNRQTGTRQTEHTLLVATPAGQYHEFGALFVAIEASSSGWQSLYIGSNLPAEEMAAAAVTSRVKAVALSLIYPEDDLHLRDEMRLLRHCLPADIQIVVGGRAASGYRDMLDAIGAVILTDMASLDRFLESAQDQGRIHPAKI